MTATIYLIRHGEKPLGDGTSHSDATSHGDATPHGIDVNGKQDADSLTPRGWQRAGALVALFGGSPGARPSPPALATPTHLFAAQTRDNGASARPRETLVPLAQSLGLRIDTRFLKEQTAELAAAALEIDGIALIAWEHHIIPTLAAAILRAGGSSGVSVPVRWPDDCFDMTWVFEHSAGGHLGFRQVPQMLLAGDRTTPIPA